ncbi:unnamed protein product, partial [Closterium sp. NIES-54]
SLTPLRSLVGETCLGRGLLFFETAPHLRRLVGRLRSPWRTPLGVLFLLASPLSYRARQPPLAPCQ